MHRRFCAPRRPMYEHMRRRSALEPFMRCHSGNWSENYVHPSLPNISHNRREMAVCCAAVERP